MSVCVGRMRPPHIAEKGTTAQRYGSRGGDWKWGIGGESWVRNLLYMSRCRRCAARTSKAMSLDSGLTPFARDDNFLFAGNKKSRPERPASPEFVFVLAVEDEDGGGDHCGPKAALVAD